MSKISNFWHVDPRVYEKVKISLSEGDLYSKSKNSPYVLVEGGQSDYQKVRELYQRCEVPDYEVSKVEVIYNKTLMQAFEAKIQALEQRHGNKAFAPKWKDDTDDKDICQTREQVDYSLSTEVARYSVANRHVKILPMFHGTHSELFDSIFRTGFDNLASTDAGYFGKGLYNTSYAEYAWRVYSKGGLVFNWVAFFSAFPVVTEDMPELVGAPKYKNYDAHFALVKPMNPKNKKEKVYVPIKLNEQATYNELVVFESSQILPRYLVTLTLKGLKLKEMAPKKNKKTLLQAMFALSKKSKADLKIPLEKKMEVLKKKESSHQELTKEEEWLEEQASEILANEDHPDQNIPNVLKEQMLQTLKIINNPETLYLEGGELAAANQFEAAFDKWKQAADLNHAEAQWKLSENCKRNKNYQEAFDFAFKASEQGIPEAQDYVGHCLYIGRSTEQNYAQAAVYFEKAAAQGNGSAHGYLGICYAEGHGVPKDDKKSFEHYLKAAQMGRPGSQYKVGIYYREGIGVEKDLAKSKYFFELAAKQGSAEAQAALANL